ncbi:SusC/RagA family TonB-linked outer membrane protein [Pleomorphovibrio marinus]|uniref:SusC/RagA family TonB-linked outer membrane protein n=1 Tax=Pleomorphovibrio marinus TaxID=2164132 RepID=UPI000E0A35EB|nr:TonB-dependent receptor [Pleomorphovibrio marinus]
MKNKLLGTIYGLSRVVIIGFFLSIGPIFIAMANDSGEKPGTMEDSRLSLPSEKLSVYQFLRTVQKATVYKVDYKSNEVNLTETLTFKSTENSLAHYLQEASAQTGLSFRVGKNKIDVVKEKEGRVILASNKEMATVTGTVTDANGDPIPGATVIIEGTNTGSVTDIDGNFSIEANEDDILVISFIGYKSTRITVGNQTNFEVVLEEDQASLDEVVVVGFGRQKAGNITGSIARANAEDLSKVATPTLAQSLQGQAAGVFIQSANAQPGENKTNINIRGFGAPLYIVDGLPVDETVFQELDPNDIEELNILKDAAAAAVYGARAGNGVILVQTKRGSISKPQFTLKSEVAAQFVLPTALPDIVSSYEWMELRNMVWENEGRPIQFTREMIESHRQHGDGSEPELYPNVNMYEEVLRKFTPMTQNNMTVRGGSENVSYFISGGWLHQRGVLSSDEIEFNRYNLRANNDIRLTDRLTLNVDISLTNRTYTGPRNQLEGINWGQGQGIMARMRRWRPFFPIADLPNPDFPRGAPQGETINPINAMYKENVGYRDWESQYGFTRLSLDYELPLGFTTRFVYNYTRNSMRWKQYQKRGPEYQFNENTGEHYVVRYVNAISEVRQRDELTENVNMQYFLEYDKDLGNNHSFHGMFVTEILSDRFEMMEAWRQNYLFDFDQLFAGPDEFQFNNNLAREGGRVGYITRFNYNYADKFNFEFNSRLDGSPRFPPETRWGFFPSVSASYMISKEPFIQNSSALHFLNALKFRGSYGTLGYDRAGDWQFLSTYSFARPYISVGNTVQRGIVTDALANPNITWETMEMANIGVDMTLWEGKLDAAIDIYQRDRTNVLGTRIRDIPDVVGAIMPQENYQEFRNRGVELMLNHQNQIGGVAFTVGGNISFNEELVRLTDEVTFTSKESERRNTRIGRWTNAVWMYPSDGLFQSQEEINTWADIDGRNNATIQTGDVRYLDTNGDGKITPEDRIIVASGNMPRVTYGINTNATWKGFNLFMSWQGAGLYGFNLANSEYNTPFDSDGAPLQHHLHDSYVPDTGGEGWRPANTNAFWPRLRQNPTGTSYSNQVQQWWINGSYLRLRQLQLSYNIPGAVLTPFGLNRMRVYVSGYNLLTFSALDFMDPEADTNPEHFFGNYHPQMGSYHFGIDVSF